MLLAVISIALLVLVHGKNSKRNPIPLNDDHARFMIIGDWGGQSAAPYTTQSQLNVANAMGKMAGQLNSQFVLAVGDNFYDYGIQTNASDPRFTETFEQVYTAAGLQVPWYVVMGNHDHRGNFTAEVAYTSRSQRWHADSLWFSEVFEFKNDQETQTLEVVFYDTVVQAGAWENNEVQPLGAADESMSQQQLQFLEKTLASSTANWLCVVGHYPVYSIGEHGPTQVLIDTVLPLLTKYGVAAYVNGHDHSAQFLSSSGVAFIVSGAGHGLDSSTKHINDVPRDSLKFHYPTKDFASLVRDDNNVLVKRHHKKNKFDDTGVGAYTSVHVGMKKFNVQYWDEENNLLYENSFPNPRQGMF